MFLRNVVTTYDPARCINTEDSHVSNNYLESPQTIVTHAADKALFNTQEEKETEGEEDRI
jgi:hypothetical protein